MTDRPVTINQDLKAFYSDQPLMNEWLALFLRMSAQDLLASSRRDGTTVQSVQYPLLKKILLPVPPVGQRKRIIEAVDAALAKQSSIPPRLAAARQAIVRLRQAILAAACSGRLTADWRATHEDASVDDLVSQIDSSRLKTSSQQLKRPAAIAETELPEIPNSWRWMSVDALARCVVDGVHKTPEYVERGIPFVTVRNLTAGPGISFESCKFIREEEHKAYTARTKPERGDILISKDGTLGVTRAIRTDRRFSIFVSVAMVKPLLYEMTDYLELALSSPQVQRQMVGVGSGLVHLVLRDLKADGIPVPPLEEQREIVSRVNHLFAVVDRLKHRVEIATRGVERSSQSILAKAFRGELTAAAADGSHG
jgi:type I restriction enzyme S subunit